MDTLFITDIVLPCNIGVTKEEQAEKQTLIINIALTVDLQKAGKTDDLEDTVSYQTIYEQIVAYVTQSRSSLLEALAHNIATICLTDKRITQAKVRIEKPKVLKLARAAAVEIIRSNT